MAGLEVTLNNALTGLNVNQQQLAVLSQNIANANTPGYSRQVANQQAVYLDGQGEGVSIEDVTRQVNEFLVQAVQGQNTTVGQTGVINTYNTSIQQLLGQPGSDNSMDTYVSNFFNNVQSLAQTPNNTALQQSVIDSGVTLASQTQQLAQGLQGLQFQADQQINGAVSSVNNDLQQLAQLNTSIASATALGQSVAGLQDQRDALLKDASQYIPIQTYTQTDGSINVTTAGGVTLLDGSTPYQLNYNPAGSVNTFADGGTMSPITVTRTDANGNPVGQPVQLVSGGPVGQVTSTLTNGSISGLLQMRDQQIPAILNQLDTFASTLRTQVNAIQNSGTGFPGASSLTGDRSVNASSYSQWSGSVQIAVLNQNGQAVASPYPDEPNGLAPLTLDLSSLNTGGGAGNPSVQGIINAINQYYGVPQNKAEVGNLNNIQMVSNSSSLPGTPAQLSFGFNLNNISANPASTFVTNVQVTDSNGNPVSTLNSPTPTIALNSTTSTYNTTANSTTVTVNTAGGNNNLVNGEQILLSDPGEDIAGIPESEMTGLFTVSNVTANSFQITVASAATSSTGTIVSGQTVTPPYATVPAGETTSSGNSPSITASLSANSTSPYYNVTATVLVDNGTGSPQTAQVTYRVNNQQTGMLGSVYGATAVTGSGTLVQPTTNQPLATAMLVDANGNPLPTVNGQYTTTQNGYLEIKTANGTNVIAINSLNSAQQGQPNNNPPVAGSNLGFSSYFGLNDFFAPNQLTPTGDTVAGSAANLQVEQRLQNDPSLLSLGSLTRSPQPADPTAPPNYTYETDAGDSSVIEKLATLGSANSINFAAAGGMGAAQQSFNGYATQIIGAASTNASNAQTANTNAQTLLTGYTQQASTISGVNLDTELANTVIYQNAYAASARVITVVGTLFDSLLAAFTS